MERERNNILLHVLKGDVLGDAPELDRQSMSHSPIRRIFVGEGGHFRQKVGDIVGLAYRKDL
eukprot:scaffold177_cov334-Pavlova_lutheri.AAC.79